MKRRSVIAVSLIAVGAVAAGSYAIPHRTEPVRGANAAGDAACLSSLPDQPPRP